MTITTDRNRSSYGIPVILDDSGDTPDYAPAARLRAARVAAGLTQAQLATTIGKSKAWIAQVEGAHRPASLETILEFSRAIGCDPHAIDPRLASTG